MSIWVRCLFLGRFVLICSFHMKVRWPEHRGELNKACCLNANKNAEMKFKRGGEILSNCAVLLRCWRSDPSLSVTSWNTQGRWGTLDWHQLSADLLHGTISWCHQSKCKWTPSSKCSSEFDSTHRHTHTNPYTCFAFIFQVCIHWHHILAHSLDKACGLSALYRRYSGTNNTYSPFHQNGTSVFACHGK